MSTEGSDQSDSNGRRLGPAHSSGERLQDLKPATPVDADPTIEPQPSMDAATKRKLIVSAAMVLLMVVNIIMT